MASYFVWINRSKESLTLDLKHPEAKVILGKLLKETDVLVQNLGPGAAARLGLSAQALRPEHPGLIVCDISGYGKDGPYRDKKAYDILIQAEAGLLSVTGTPDDPSRAGVSAADISAGMYAYTNILAALIQRGRTGKGSHIDVSMLEALGEWMGNPLYYAYKGQTPPPRAASSHPSIAPYGPFRTGDGKSVLLGVQNEREWALFCQIVLEKPEVATDERFNSNVQRNANRQVLRELIEQIFASLNAEQVTERLERASIGNANMNTMNDLWAHPQLKARDRWRDVQSPIGTLPALLPPGVNDSFEYRMDPIPSLGEHTDAILGELGYAANDIEGLRAAGAI
jgi:itaconate CoA-transferase